MQSQKLYTDFGDFDMEYAKVFVPIDPAASINNARFEQKFTIFPHSSYEWEQIYCSFVRNGDVDGARQFMNYIASSGKVVNVGNVSSSSISQVKYLAVSLIPSTWSPLSRLDMALATHPSG